MTMPLTFENTTFYNCGWSLNLLSLFIEVKVIELDLQWVLQPQMIVTISATMCCLTFKWKSQITAFTIWIIYRLICTSFLFVKLI